MKKSAHYNPSLYSGLVPSGSSSSQKPSSTAKTYTPYRPQPAGAIVGNMAHNNRLKMAAGASQKHSGMDPDSMAAKAARKKS